MPPSLHAGLIERLRRPGVSPLTRRSPAPLNEVDLPEGLVRVKPARPVVVSAAPAEQAAPATLVEAAAPVAKPVPVAQPAPVAHVVPATQVPPAANSTPSPKGPKRRRFALTVRVSPSTRKVLEQVRESSGKTFQKILHDALTDHLQLT